MTKLMILGFAAGCASLVACSSIRVVQKTQSGGVVALQGDREGATEKAHEYMRAQCPQGFDVIEEGEAVVGQEIQTETRQSRSIFGPSQTTNGSTTDKREWRIKYACKGAQPGKQGAVHELIVTF